MKSVCFILSVYALILAITPCADGFCGGDEQLQSVVAHENEKADDLCSSFCICSCCGYSAQELNSSPSRLVASIPLCIELNSLYKTPHVTDFSIDFWQPPKIG